MYQPISSLGRALDHVDKLKGQGVQAIAIDQIKYAALTCRYPLEDFLSEARKYEKSLGLGNLDSKVKDVGRKIGWGVGKKPDVDRLRDYLNIHIGTINMLLMQHGLEMLDVAARQTDRNQADLITKIENSSRELREVRGDAQAQLLAVRATNSMLHKLLWMVCGDNPTSFKALGDMVSKVWYAISG